MQGGKWRGSNEFYGDWDSRGRMIPSMQIIQVCGFDIKSKAKDPPAVPERKRVFFLLPSLVA